MKKSFLKRIKKMFLYNKFFLEEEKRFFIFLFLAILMILLYVFTNRIPEKIVYGVEIMEAVYDISIALLIGIIFYYLQVFLPKVDRRKNAQRELNFIINDINRLIGLIISHYYSDKELCEIKFANNPSKYIYNNIDKVSQYFEDNLKIKDIIRFEWNKTQKTFLDEFFEKINNYNKNYRELLLKYGGILESKTLHNLEEIYRNCIFINIREYKNLSQHDIDKHTFKKLLKNIKNIQDTADKINSFAKC